MKKHLKPSKKKALYLLGSLLFLWFLFSLPKQLFNDPYSTVLLGRDGNMLSARIAEDGQWRFPESKELPDKFVKAITNFEDAYFFYHPGINPVSILRAFKQNLAAGKIVSGGSTITMQTIRLSRKGQPRTITEKIIEIIRSFQMEIRYSKKEILNLYASHAPFGGNVVGLEAASRRYFGRKPSRLSWGEICTLAVLPNAPALIYPGKNQIRLRAKRDRLLDKLLKNKVIDEETCELAKMEELPGKPHPVPSIAPHLLDRTVKEGEKGKRIHTTIDLKLQRTINKIIDQAHSKLSQNEIHNMAAIVISVESSEVLAYVGNSNCPQENSGRNVDIITSPRSTGSILKPFLYTFMLQEGDQLPKTLVKDIPTRISGFSPRNYEKTYDGMVHADEALARSLNIPAVRMLQKYGIEKFYDNLKKLGLSTLNKPPGHYGLSLILGGAEATLWDLSNAYLQMSQTLKDADQIKKATFYLNDPEKEQKIIPERIFDTGALWWTAEALSGLNRPLEETGWKEFGSSQKIAWKTGTSFGHRDAWAIGMTPKYIVGVWAGNADGEGRPGLTGTTVASPVMFRIFKQLNSKIWFEKPDWDLITADICVQSGYLASDICEETVVMQIPRKGIKTGICPFHKIIRLDKEKKYRVNSSCYSVNDMVLQPWFIIPPVPEWYFKQKNPFYRSLPPYLPGCNRENFKNMDVIYPKDHTKIFIPRELDGSKGKSVFEVAHREPGIKIFWHLDDKYIGETRNTHRMEIDPAPGKHTMTLVDENGESLSWKFEVIR
jgi:penicillin-binding protein 1C